ncbi:T9SS type A sorting domain-containing protein [Mariniflexile litorale]|uniref:T9SS type A sorting domain-containing protein n=1 Tax=Mariniflexile litorale TaxID=3045158 RepID=A0AAU7EG31_9FLAO|nr:T9SS type A sorting domain-containing protein [Mariniflexile sp. KMM 9835]MDQ8211653.1 T9SS type A sorting domain-containing protein [Mariniflexile sp. KMM 9835]
MTLIFLGLGTINTNAQESLNTSGGIVSGSDGSINQSIGQMFNNPVGDSNQIMYQGVQYAVDLISLDTNSYEFELSIMAFPNPSSSELNLQVSKINNNDLSYEMYDLLGRLVKSSSISAEKTKINIENLQNAVYQLNVFSNNKNLIKSFKIIKN